MEKINPSPEYQRYKEELKKIDLVAEELLNVLIKNEVTFSEATRIQVKLKDKILDCKANQLIKKESEDS